MEISIGVKMQEENFSVQKNRPERKMQPAHKCRVYKTTSVFAMVVVAAEDPLHKTAKWLITMYNHVVQTDILTSKITLQDKM